MHNVAPRAVNLAVTKSAWISKKQAKAKHTDPWASLSPHPLTNNGADGNLVFYFFTANYMTLYPY